MLPVAVARSVSDGVAIRHVHPILWIASYFYTMGPMGRIEHDVMYRRSSAAGGSRWTSEKYSVQSSSSKCGTGAKSAIYD